MVTSCKAEAEKDEERQRQYTKPLRLAERICQIARTARAPGQGNVPLQEKPRPDSTAQASCGHVLSR
jgi:hypothetical protein